MRQNSERQKFDTSSAQSVALCDVKATLIHTPFRSCAKPKSTFLTILNSPCMHIVIKKLTYLFWILFRNPARMRPNLVNNIIFCTPFQSLSPLSRFSVASNTIRFGTWKYAVWNGLIYRNVWLAKTLAKAHLLLPS